MERIMLTLPADLLQEVDALAERTRQKRSQVIRQALSDLLERQRKQEFEALLAEGYQEMAEAAADVAEEARLAQAEAVEGIWSWDE